MIIRAKDLKIIDSDTEKTMMRSYGANKWNRIEPLDDEIGIEHPELLKDAFYLILNEGRQSKSGLVEAIPIPRTEIEELAGLERDFLLDNIVRLQLRRDRFLQPNFSQLTLDGSNVVPIMRLPDD